MEATTYSNFRTNLKKYMNKVNDNAEPMIVTNKEDKNVVVMSQSDYDNMQENLYIFGSEANRDHINKSLDEFAKGKSIELNIEDL